MMKIFLIMNVFCFFSVFANADVIPNRTYYVEIYGDSQLKKALLQKLTAKLCFKLRDIEENTELSDCYAFAPNSKKTNLSSANTYLFKIKLKGNKESNQPRLLSVQGFKSNGKSMARYFGSGNFSIPSKHQVKTGKADFSDSQFVEQASDTIIGLAFK